MRSIANNFTRLREVNAELIRAALKAVESATKASLAAATGLSVATCGNILSEMVTGGEALELEFGAAEGGRPPRLYSYAPLFALTALIFPKAAAGEKHFLYAVMDAKGGTVEQNQQRVNRADLPAIDRLIEQLRAKHPTLRATAVSIPGVVTDGRIGFCDIPELENVEVESHLRERHGLSVSLENDMNLAALGYYHTHFTGREGSLVYIVVPSKNCTGAGIVVNGMLIRGHTGFAGELSCVPFGISRKRQFAGLKAKEALEYTAKLAAAVIPVINPSTLVVASTIHDAKTLEQLRRYCLEHVPLEHMPNVVLRDDINADCFSGLALTAASCLSGKVRLVEDQ